MVRVSRERFEALVDEALAALPPSLLDNMENVAVLVEDHPPEPGLLGLYDGIPLTERQGYGEFGTLPDRIWIYRLPLCEMCETDDEVRDEIGITVVHEIAHHFGIDDDRLDELGWA